MHIGLPWPKTTTKRPMWPKSLSTNAWNIDNKPQSDTVQAALSLLRWLITSCLRHERASWLTTSNLAYDLMSGGMWNHFPLRKVLKADHSRPIKERAYLMQLNNPRYPRGGDVCTDYILTTSGLDCFEIIARFSVEIERLIQSAFTPPQYH